MRTSLAAGTVPRTGGIHSAHPHAIVASPDHLLARRDGIAAAQLQDKGFIVREPGSGTRAVMEAFFRAERIAPPFIMEMASNETIKQAVIANMGLAFLSLHTVGPELKTRELVVLDVNGLPIVRRWHIVNLQAKPLSPAAEALRYFVLERGEALIAAQFSDTSPIAPALRKSRRKHA